MKRMSSWSTAVFTTLMLLACMTGVSWGATASGTISYSGAKDGRIYITAEYAGQPVGQPYPTPQYRGIGTSIANKTATFTLNGLQAGSYTLRAFMDVSNSGVQHANDPVTTTFPLLTIPNNSSSVSAGTITLADPTPVALTAPAGPMVFASQNGTGAIVSWKKPQDANQREIPTSYTVTWSSGASDATIVGSKTNIVANGSEMWIHNTATPYSYKITAMLDGSPASTAWVSVTQPPAGTRSISGTVTYSGVTPTGPLFIAAVPPNNGGPPLSISISSPAQNSNGFTIPSLPDGSYNLYAFIDMNNNGIDDAGDYRLMNQTGVPVTVTGGNVTGVTVPLPISDVSFTLATQHMFSGEPGSTNSGESYSYEINISPQLKVPVKAQILNGTNISAPVDMGIGYEKGSLRLSIDNMVTGIPSYSFNIKVCYDDACTTNSATFPFSGTATFLQSPPLPTAPIGGVAYASSSPLQWLPPPTLPAYYSLNINSDNGFNFWTEGIVPSSVSYTDAGLTLPANASSYYWTISAHDNASPSNSVSYQAQFTTAQSAPVISGISPASLYFGGTISIFGHNLGTTTGVSIGGKPAVSFIVINSNQITAVVPQDPAGHIIVVTNPSGSGSSNILLGSGAPISLTGSVKDTAGIPIPGATVQLVGNPVVSATSDINGNFTISNLPNNFAFMLRIVHPDPSYIHTYTHIFNSSQNIITSTAYTLRSAVQFAGLGVPAGKGAIMARATDANGVNLAGATFIYGSLKGLTYTVKYYDSVAKTFTGSATDSSGIVLIPDASHGDLITLTPAKAGWLFQSQQGRGALGSVTALGGISALQPDVTNVSTSSGMVGSPVTITGHNFTQDATVTFNGTSAVITGNTGSVLTLNVPNGATTGPLVVSSSGIQLNAVTFTVLPTSYTLTKTIVGNGQINDGVSPCLSGNCISTHDKDAPIALSAAESYGSVFGNWSGACTGTNKTVCSFSMTSDKSVTATFSKLENVQITAGVSTTISDTLTNAYATVSQNGTTIKALRSFVFTEDFAADKAFTVKLLGGFDSFTGTNANNYTTIDLVSLPFTVSRGELTIENIIIK